MSVKAGIRQLEQRIARRRTRMGAAWDGVTQAVGERIVSPAALVAAGLFGAALQRDQRRRGLGMPALLEATNTGLRLLVALSSRLRAGN